MTSDYGMVDVPVEDARWDASASPALDAGVTGWRGSMRVHVHAHPGAAADVLAAGAEFWALTVRRVPRGVAFEKGGLRPTVAPEFARADRDVAAALRTDGAVDDLAQAAPARSWGSSACTGRLTSAELGVPLVQ